LTRPSLHFERWSWWRARATLRPFSRGTTQTAPGACGVTGLDGLDDEVEPSAYVAVTVNV
jgi:hypothetical protein